MSASASSSLLWLTPDVPGSGPTLERKDGQMRGDRLDYVMEQFWSTPRSSDGEKGGPNQQFGAGGIPLPAQASQWATPQARDHMPPHSPERIAAMKAEGHGMRNLNDEATQWAMPTSLSYAESHQPGNSKSYNETMRLASFLPDRPISTDGEESSHIRRTLNPLFVSWLMNWMPGFSELCATEPASINSASLEMEWSRYRRLSLSALSRIGLPQEAPKEQLSLFG